MEIEELKILYSTGSVNELFKALAQAQGEFIPLEKSQAGHFGRYADSQEIRKATQDALTKYGLAITQSNGKGKITSVLGHSSGQHIVYETYFTMKGSSQFDQASSWTFMRRYALMAMLNIQGTDDTEKSDGVVFKMNDGLSDEGQALLDNGLKTKGVEEFNQYYATKQLQLKRLQKESEDEYDYIDKKFKKHKDLLKEKRSKR